MIANRFNWLALVKVFVTFENPSFILLSIARRRAPPEVLVRTPVGRISIMLRNFESLKTVFSIFCRGDYWTPSNGPSLFIDVGANIGIASAYFLSRNLRNRVTSYEPDEANVPLLIQNLKQFGDRGTIHPYALGTRSGIVTLFQAADGKYSSLIPSDLARSPTQIECRSFLDELRDPASGDLPVVVKLDVEGMELELVKCVQWQEFPTIHRLICESTECSANISRPHRRVLRSGYIEDLSFVDVTPGG